MPFERFVLDWLIILPCLGLCFFFSGMEAGVFSINRWRVRQREKRGDRSAALVHKYLENPESFLWTNLVGNTLTAVTVFVLSARSLYSAMHHSALAFVPIYLLFLFAFYTFCDLLPKTLFRLYPTRLTLILARPFAALHLLLKPLVSVIENVSAFLLRYTGGQSFKGRIFGSRQELRNVMRESAQGLSSEERVMIERVMDLQNTRVREIMLAPARFPQVHQEMTAEEILAGRPGWELQDTLLIPVWQGEGRQRRIAGMLNLRNMLYARPESRRELVKEHLQGAIYLEETLHLEEALRRMQKSGQTAAVVLDASRREVGIVRLIEILNTIFGEVRL